MSNPAAPDPLKLAVFASGKNFSDNASIRDQCLSADLFVALGGVDLDEISPLVPPNRPAVCVLGPRDDRPKKGSPFASLHATGFNIRGWRVAGLSGALLRNTSSRGRFISESEAESLLEGFPASDLFFSHAAPAGVAEVEDAGFSNGLLAITDYLNAKKPIFHFWAAPPGMDDLVVAYNETLTIGVSGFLLTPPLMFI